MSTFIMVLPTSEEEFQARIDALIATQILTQEKEDFDYLAHSVNDLLTKLMNYRAKQCTIESLFLDTTFFFALRTDPICYGASKEEARTLFLQGLEMYFTNPEQVRERAIHLRKLERLNKMKETKEEVVCLDE